MQKPAHKAGNYKVGTPYQISGVWYYPEGRSVLRRNRRRLLVRRGLPRQGDGKRRTLRHGRTDGRAPHAADAHGRAGHEPRERPLDQIARQRSRTIRARPHHRCLAPRRQTFGVLGQRHRARARSIRGPGRSRRLAAARRRRNRRGRKQHQSSARVRRRTRRTCRRRPAPRSRHRAPPGRLPARRSSRRRWRRSRTPSPTAS